MESNPYSETNRLKLFWKIAESSYSIALIAFAYQNYSCIFVNVGYQG